MNTVILAVAAGVAAVLAFSRRVEGSSTWQATVTPLASIMGSGFLVSAPLLGGVAGNLAVAAMAVLLLLAYGVGAAIRFNIRHFEPIEHGHGPAQSLGLLSRLVLTGAYFVSISYYLQLLAAFLLNAAGMQDPFLAHLVASALLVAICGIGLWRGLSELVLVERYAVALNLGMIAALLVALALHNGGLALAGHWALPHVEVAIHLRQLRVVLGLLIVVQGFESSRYLGEAFPPELRIATMRRAQLVSAIIYLVFVALTTVLFRPDLGSDVTGVITMTAPVAAVLPLLLTVAAIGSQFSAAVADTEGADGLIADLGGGRISSRHAYALVLAVTLGLTWQSDVNEIISYASRAFALYYTLQCAMAFRLARTQPDVSGRGRRLALFGAMTVAASLVFALGVPAE